MAASKGKTMYLDIGVKNYECSCSNGSDLKVRICLLCVSQGKPRNVSHMDNRWAPAIVDTIVNVRHFMEEHILPSEAIKKLDATDCLIRYKITSDELGLQTLCDKFLSSAYKIPQLCYLIPLTPYDLIISNKQRIYPDGFTDFNDCTNIYSADMTYAIRYLKGQSYACLYCGREYDVFPPISLVYSHITSSCLGSAKI